MAPGTELEIVRDASYRDHARRTIVGPAWVWLIGVSVGLLVIAAIEVKTSFVQSWLFTTLSSSLTYDVRPGAATVIVFPRGGPVDLERGYANIPEYAHRLNVKGFRVIEQARFSKTLAIATRFGFTPPYAERHAVGLVVRGQDRGIVYDATPRDHAFADVSELPVLIEKSLLFVEDRELGEPADLYRNPAVDWDRLAKAALQYTGSRIGLPYRQEGGSTLAVQMEKYRHSEAGRTEHPIEKLRQMGSASLRAYHSGPDTRAARRRIVLEYLNTVPLAAYRGHGEVRGFKEGLRLWFGRDPDDVIAALAKPEASKAKARAFKESFALLCAVRAPTHYLVRDREALETRVNAYTHLLTAGGILEPELAEQVRDVKLRFSKDPVEPAKVHFNERKATDLTRRQLARLLGTPNFYALDHLDLDVETTIDAGLQRDVESLFVELKDPKFVEAHGLRGERLLAQSDPRSVVYSFALFEKAKTGDLVRVHADNLDKPFDVNHGMKMELGSTAKLRTLAHYLDIMSILHTAHAGLDRKTLAKIANEAADPLTEWSARTLIANPIGIDAFLEAALQREYSANPGEMFWTGGGIHYFNNFDKEDNHKVLTLREATAHSTNLVFIRLMRDVVRYHQAHLPYDARAVIADVHHPDRQRLLEQAADEEARVFLSRGFRKYRGTAPSRIPEAFLGARANVPRDLTVLYVGMNPDADSATVHRWLAARVRGITGKEVSALLRRYTSPRFTLADYAYLLDRHPLEVWCAGELMRDSSLTWKQAVERSREARKVAMAWLVDSKRKEGQDTRIRSLIERDAFERMEPSWKKLGFPFERLVPSYATSIGSSADRPDALATLMGIIVDDGVKREPRLLEKLRFGQGTPYHTVFQSPRPTGEQVLPAPVAKALRGVLADVVDHGTAQRVRAAFADSLGKPIVVVGGKTGSGDNRVKAINKGGGVMSSRATSRTAAFTFYIGDRYYGVITASVMGPKAENYSFTSALPLEVLKLSAPSILQRIVPPAPPAPKPELVAKAEPEKTETEKVDKPAADKADVDDKADNDRPAVDKRGDVEMRGDVQKPDAARSPARDGVTDEKAKAAAPKRAKPEAEPPAPKIRRLLKPEHTAPASGDSLSPPPKKRRPVIPETAVI